MHFANKKMTNILMRFPWNGCTLLASHWSGTVVPLEWNARLTGVERSSHWSGTVTLSVNFN